MGEMLQRSADGTAAGRGGAGTPRCTVEGGGQLVLGAPGG